jgi:hypothetical protein
MRQVVKYNVKVNNDNNLNTEGGPVKTSLWLRKNTESKWMIGDRGFTLSLLY